MAASAQVGHRGDRFTNPSRPRAWKRISVAAVSAAAAALVAGGARGADGAGAEWTTPGGTVQGTRFSQLSQITSANAASLIEEFAVPTNAVASHQGQPLVVGRT